MCQAHIFNQSLVLQDQGNIKTQNSDLICSQESIGVVPPPNTHTVKKTMSRVVVNIICRAYVAVSRIARANAIAPLSPIEQTRTHVVGNHNSVYMLTKKKHHICQFV